MRTLLGLLPLLLTGCPLVILDVRDAYTTVEARRDVLVISPHGGDVRFMGPVLPLFPDPTYPGWPVTGPWRAPLSISIPKASCPGDPHGLRLVTHTAAVAPSAFGDDLRYTHRPCWRVTFPGELRFGEPVDLVMDGQTVARLRPSRSVSLGLILLPFANPCTWSWDWSYALPELHPTDDDP